MPRVTLVAICEANAEADSQGRILTRQGVSQANRMRGLLHGDAVSAFNSAIVAPEVSTRQMFRILGEGDAGIKVGGDTHYLSELADPQDETDLPRFNWMRRQYGAVPLSEYRKHSCWHMLEAYAERADDAIENSRAFLTHRKRDTWKVLLIGHPVLLPAVLSSLFEDFPSDFTEAVEDVYMDECHALVFEWNTNVKNEHRIRRLIVS